MRTTIRIVLLALAFTPALAHDQRPDWIPSSCCSVEGSQADCQSYGDRSYRAGEGGYELTFRNVITGRPDRETIPYSEALPISKDGRLWVCRDPISSKRRCVFSPPQSG